MTTSSAITFNQYGGPEVLELQRRETPVAGPGQVVIRVEAAGINPIDSKIRRGFMEEVFPTQFPSVPGSDAAGIVESVGAGVDSVSVGDAVFGIAVGGSYAERAVLGQFVAKPESLSWEFAAALPAVGEVAVRVLGQLGVVAGETLLIHGAAGSAGTIATQLAVAQGVTVIGSASDADQEFVRSLGAQPVVYGNGLVERVRALVPEGVDAVFDTSGAGVLPDSIELASGAERVITIADMSAAALGVRFSGMSPDDRAPEALPIIADLAAAGSLTLRIARTYPLADAAAAHRDLDAGGVSGKLVLLP